MKNDITRYPEGYEQLKEEELVFLPDNQQIKDEFMLDILQFLTQW